MRVAFADFFVQEETQLSHIGYALRSIEASRFLSRLTSYRAYDAPFSKMAA